MRGATERTSLRLPSIPEPAMPTRVRPRLARRVTTVVLLTASVVASACSDRATEPSRAATGLTPSAISATRSFPTGLATVEWNGQARSLVISHGRTPIVAGRGYALLAMAQYGGVVAADADDDDLGTVPDDGFGDGGRRRFEAERGAIAGASAQVLTYLYSADNDAAAVRQAVEARVAQDGDRGPGNVNPFFTRGVAIGRTWGDRLVAWGLTDGFSKKITEVPLHVPTGVGLWTPAPPPALPAGYQYPWMRPYFLESTSQFHAPTPPVYMSTTDPTFNDAIALVRGFSFLAATDPLRIEQIRIAKLRDLGVGTETGLGGWDEVAEGYIAETGMDERAASHVLAVMNAAVADAVLGCWESKYTYFYIRPSQSDPTIKTVLSLPNHPSYPSGHSCVSGAASTVIAAFFPQHAGDAEALMIENGNSRLYAGIHYPFDVSVGQALGKKVGAVALAYDRGEGGVLRAIP